MIMMDVTVLDGWMDEWMEYPDGSTACAGYDNTRMVG